MPLSDWLLKGVVDPDVLKDEDEETKQSPHSRFLHAWHNKTASPLDLTVLLRCVLRWESLKREYRWSLNLPQEIGKLISPHAKKCGLEFSPDCENQVSADPWFPTWLENPSEEVDICHYPQDRRPIETCEGDPILARFGWDTYTSVAQRDALRSILCSPPGQTLAVCMPTGSGKSLCAFVPSLLTTDGETDSLGVSVIVVPTVSLQLDLARRLRSLIGHSTAYRPNEEDEALGIRDRCVAGNQGPIIVSPEALQGRGLRDALCRAARNNHMRYFIVDEAHMVLNWGDEFRPAFLSLAAIRDQLLTKDNDQKLVTVLLSATFTDYHLRWLKNIFSQDCPFQIIHAMRLRAEPAYWLTQASSQESRESYIYEAITHLPRPAIIYTTHRKACSDLFSKLKKRGFKRLEKITGGTNDTDRKKSIDKWNNDELDIIIATSAFGLGIDKSDVRTIIHAQIPESVDRYYQDVGRSGRDGKSSFSLLLTTPEDWSEVQGITSPTFIGAEKGLKRWKRMFESRQSIKGDDLGFLLDLSVGSSLDMTGDYNSNWNLQVIHLLRRAGALDYLPSEQSAFGKVAIRLNARPHSSIEYWENDIGKLRKEILDDYKISGNLLSSLTGVQKGCLSELFADCYASPTFELQVITACGGCPACRRNEGSPSCGRIIARRSPSDPPPTLPLCSDISTLLGRKKRSLIHYSERPKETELDDIFYWLASQGISNFIAPESTDASLIRTANRGRHFILFQHRSPPLNLDVTSNQSVCVFLEYPLPKWWPKFHAYMDSFNIPLVIIAPFDLVCPNDNARLIRQIFTGEVMGMSNWANQFVE